MAVSKKDDHAGAVGSRAFFVPVLWILALVGAYCVLADWHAVPTFIAATVASIH